MRFIDLLRMSASNLWRRKLRTFLTVLGVIIGTASIVVMISLGLGLTKSTMEQIEKKNHEEMEFARGVQHSALPSPDSVRPVNGEYEILGLMDTAKEVGGDFFDYFLV